MSSVNVDLKTIVDASVSVTKPKFDEIDRGRLAAFVERRSGAQAPVRIFDVTGGGEKAGASSGIVVFSAQIDRRIGRYVLRYAPMNNEGRIFADYGVDRQFELQRRLHAAGMPVPNAHWVDRTGEELGLPGFVMDRIDGEVADGSPYTGGLIATASEPVRAALIAEIFQALDKVHRVDWRGLELANSVRDGGGRTPFERYLNWFWKTAEWLRPQALERLDRVRHWLFENQPVYHPDDYTLVHGDPGLGNYMFTRGKVVSIIDWELAGIVHPTYDIAMQCSLNGYFRSAATSDIEGKIPSDLDWISRYERVSGRPVSDLEFYRKAVCLPSLIVNLSMHRNIPGEFAAAHLEMMEATWAVAEAR